jgi:hypothetical protein
MKKDLFYKLFKIQKDYSISSSFDDEIRFEKVPIYL